MLHTATVQQDGHEALVSSERKNIQVPEWERAFKNILAFNVKGITNAPITVHKTDMTCFPQVIDFLLCDDEHTLYSLQL